MISGKLFIAGLIGAMGLWIGFPNKFVQLPLAVFLWPLALVYLGINAESCARAFRFGWLCTFAGMVCAMYWLYLPIHTVGQLPVAASLACAFFVCLCLAVQGALFSLGAFCFKGPGIFGFSILLALLWYILEYLFALAVGVPWLPLCGALAACPLLIQGACLTGAYALGAIWLLGLLLLFCPLYEKIDRGISLYPLPSMAGIAILFSLLAFGALRLYMHPQALNKAGEAEMTALFIEGNVDQNQKWLPVFQTSTLDLYMRLSREGLAEIPDREKSNLLLLWPETALPFFLETNAGLMGRLARFVEDIRLPLLFGAPGMEEGKSLEDSRIYNRAWLINSDGQIEGFYDKEHLVPFGEYVPSWLQLNFLEPLLQGVGIYSEGQNPNPLLHGSLALGLLICYEGIFPWLAQERVDRGANILVDISNDGWFGSSPAALQHLYLTLVRCVEQNRWLLRSTNTGLSAIVDNLGRIRLAGESFKRGFLYGNARLIEKKSIYHAFAPYLPWSALSVFIILLIKFILKDSFRNMRKGKGSSCF